MIYLNVIFLLIGAAVAYGAYRLGWINGYHFQPIGEDLPVWSCCCSWWYAGEPFLQVYETEPDEDTCHRWDCGWATLTPVRGEYDPS